MPEPIAKWNSKRDVWERTETPIFGPLDVYSETFPTSGMTVNGVAYELPTWEHRTADSESLSLLLTPVASEGTKPSNVMGVARREANGQAFLTNQIVTLCGLDPSEKLLKTPTSQLAVNGGSQHPDQRKAGGHGPTLADEIEHLLPTPAACVANDGESTDTWLARRERVKLTAANGNGMGMPLTIAALLIQESTGVSTSSQSGGGKAYLDVPLLHLPSQPDETAHTA